MDRKLVAICILGVIAAVVAMSGCTSGPATNATVKPTPTNVTVVNKTMTNVSDNTGIPGNATTFTGANPLATAINNSSQVTVPGSSPTVKPK